jgi:hypothetical protein
MLYERKVTRRELSGVLLLAVLVTACTSSGTSGSAASNTQSPTVAPIAPATCPNDISAGAYGKHAVSGTTQSIVPDAPQVLVICGPSPRMSDGESPRVVVSDSGLVGQVIDGLNGLELAPKGSVYRCSPPISYGGNPPAFGLFFNYENGNVLVVRVGGGCIVATNGTRTGTGARSVEDLLFNAVSAAASPSPQPD